MATQARRRDDDNINRDIEESREHDANEDPITGAPGAHPVGSGIGAAVVGAGGAVAGGAAGAAMGTAGGPVGIAAGAIIGGLVGGLAGKGVAEWIDPTEEHRYWQSEYRNRDYVTGEEEYDRYAPAYQYGWESYSRHGRHGQGEVERFEEVEPTLRQEWEKHRSDKDLTWDKARPATRDAWDRVHERGAKTKR